MEMIKSKLFKLDSDGIKHATELDEHGKIINLKLLMLLPWERKEVAKLERFVECREKVVEFEVEKAKRIKAHEERLAARKAAAEKENERGEKGGEGVEKKEDAAARHMRKVSDKSNSSSDSSTGGGVSLSMSSLSIGSEAN
jgi:hypothetical protein